MSRGHDTNFSTRALTSASAMPLVPPNGTAMINVELSVILGLKITDNSTLILRRGRSAKIHVVDETISTSVAVARS